MSSNSIAISRELLAAGVEEKTASAVADAIVKHSNDHYAAKVEILELKSSLKEEINALRNQLNPFEAETRAEFRAARAESKAFQAQTEAKLEGIRREMNSRFNILAALIVATFIGVYAPMLQNLFGG